MPTALIFLSLLVIPVLFYVFVGFLLADGLVFGRKQTNPIQDHIYWMNVPATIILWPLLLLAWLLSGALSKVCWPDYVSHEYRIEQIVDDIVAKIDNKYSNSGNISYGIPSPSTYRKHGRAAIKVTIHED